jgi:hypothetical protein
MRRRSIPVDVDPDPAADFSDVQEVRVRLIREDHYGSHEEAQLRALDRVIASGMTLDAFHAEIRRRFGPWPKASRDKKNRVVWTRRETAELGRGLHGPVTSSERTVIV